MTKTIQELEKEIRQTAARIATVRQSAQGSFVQLIFNAYTALFNAYIFEEKLSFGEAFAKITALDKEVVQISNLAKTHLGKNFTKILFNSLYNIAIDIFESAHNKLEQSNTTTAIEESISAFSLCTAIWARLRFNFNSTDPTDQYSGTLIFIAEHYEVFADTLFDKFKLLEDESLFTYIETYYTFSNKYYRLLRDNLNLSTVKSTFPFATIDLKTKIKEVDDSILYLTELSNKFKKSKSKTQTMAGNILLSLKNNLNTNQSSTFTDAPEVDSSDSDSSLSVVTSGDVPSPRFQEDSPNLANFDRFFLNVSTQTKEQLSDIDNETCQQIDSRFRALLIEEFNKANVIESPHQLLKEEIKKARLYNYLTHIDSELKLLHDLFSATEQNAQAFTKDFVEKIDISENVNNIKTEYNTALNKITARYLAEITQFKNKLIQFTNIQTTAEIRKKEINDINNIAPKPQQLLNQWVSLAKTLDVPDEKLEAISQPLLQERDNKVKLIKKRGIESINNISNEIIDDLNQKRPKQVESKSSYASRNGIFREQNLPRPAPLLQAASSINTITLSRQ